MYVVASWSRHGQNWLAPLYVKCQNGGLGGWIGKMKLKNGGLGGSETA